MGECGEEEGLPDKQEKGRNVCLFVGLNNKAKVVQWIIFSIAVSKNVV